jgi:alpha-tubulin suppressor-like RCC1 family protein
MAGTLMTPFDGVPPVLVAGLENVISIAAGEAHNAVVTADGRVATWGTNTSGQLGRNSDEENEAIPTFLDDINDAESVACGNYMTAIVHQNGTVSTFGEGGPSLGLGEGIWRQNTPERIPGLENVVAVSISTGNEYHCFVLALHRDGRISIFGNGRRLLEGLGPQIFNPLVVEEFDALR